MIDLHPMDFLNIFVSLVFHLVLIIHFALRKWRFAFAIKYGWIVYALSIPSAVASLFLLFSGSHWSLWLGGFLYLIWAVFGYFVEYQRKLEWRDPIYWPVFIPYITLYLATVMFYWWPVANIFKPLWYLYTAFFVAGTILNVSSHQPVSNKN